MKVEVDHSYNNFPVILFYKRLNLTEASFLGELSLEDGF